MQMGMEEVMTGDSDLISRLFGLGYARAVRPMKRFFCEGEKELLQSWINCLVFSLLSCVLGHDILS